MSGQPDPKGHAQNTKAQNSKLKISSSKGKGTREKEQGKRDKLPACVMQSGRQIPSSKLQIPRKKEKRKVEVEDC